MIRIGLLFFHLGFMIAVLIGLLIKSPAETIYKYQDIIQFCDKATEEVRRTIENAEFRALNKDGIMYGTKIKVGGKEREVLVMDKVPPDCFLVITKDSK